MAKNPYQNPYQIPETIMQLFDTNQYTTGTASDFELQDSSQRKKGKQPTYDPAWDDGSAWGATEDKAELKEGDRLRGASPINKPDVPGTEGTILKVVHKKYTILWDNGHTGEYTKEMIDDYGYQRVAGSACLDSSEVTNNDCLDSLEVTDDACPDSSDRWNPDHFDFNPTHKADGQQLTIFLETGAEPPEPDDFKTIAEYEEAWKRWELSSSLICAAGLAVVSHLQDSGRGGLNSLASPKSAPIAQTSSKNDSQQSQILDVSKTLPILAHAASNQTLLPHPLPALPSVFKESDSEPTTPETASPQSSELLKNHSQSFSSLKTCEDSSPVRCDQEQKNPTLDFSSSSFPAAGMMSSGKLFQAEALERPSLEKGYSWLESPNALSSVGRSPGLSKLEGSLIKQGILQRGQVLNPIFLEGSFGIPEGWTDPSECRPATELLEEEEKPSAMLLTPELQRSPSEESNTYNQLPPSQSEEIPENFSEETKKDRRRGCLYKYLENKKLKDGTIASYPRVIGDRNPDNPKDWRWGFNWEEKIDGQWKNRSLGCVPVGAIPMIQQMQKSDVPLQEIVDFIRRSKSKVQ